MHVLIVGGGIGGLAAALSLHAAGIGCTVFEQVENPRELGVGINTLPHAIKELAALGLLPALDRAGIRTISPSLSRSISAAACPYASTSTSSGVSDSANRIPSSSASATSS